jgi:hypothetical protein
MRQAITKAASEGKLIARLENADQPFWRAVAAWSSSPPICCPRRRRRRQGNPAAGGDPC